MVVVLGWWQDFIILMVFSNSNGSVILYSLQGVVAAHPNFSRREEHTRIQQSGLSSSAQATGCPTRTKNKYLRVVNSHSHHPPKSLFNQFPHKENLKFITITKSSPAFPHEGKFVRDLLKAWLGRQIWNKKNPKPILSTQYFMKHLYGKSKISLIFSEGRDTFIIPHHMFMETSKERASGTQYFILSSAGVLSSKDGKLFAKLSGSLSASALLKGNSIGRNTDVTKIIFQRLEGIFLPDLGADHGFAKSHSANKNAHVKLQTPAQTPQGHFTHL